MRVIKSMSIAAMAFSLTSCNSLTTDQQATINQVLQGAVKACGFMPTVETVLSLLGGTTGQGVSSTIAAICAAVAPAPGVAAAASSKAGQPMTATTPQGKPVAGMFVR